MDRKHFLKLLSFAPFSVAAMQLKHLNRLSESFKPSPKMPVLFLGHGSPMNAIEENEFVAGFRKVAQTLAQPQAILCVSAHWETKGTRVTVSEHPQTIHDFGGFPPALFEVQYPAPGSPELARLTQEIVQSTSISLDDKWGLDHGAWSVIKHLYPNANIPVIQMSLDYSASPQQHYDLARELSVLRHKGILIIGSGNMVHNLGKVAWDKMQADDYAYDWAREADMKMRQWIMEGNHQALINFRKQGSAFDLAIPSPEHYLPLLYSVALQQKGDELSLFNTKAVAGSLTMSSLKIA